jgi:hypothetical protein
LADASGNWNADGDWDEHEPPFSEAELDKALDWRQRHSKKTAARPDLCPHEEVCESLQDCVEKIAWYFRHRYGKDTA